MFIYTAFMHSCQWKNSHLYYCVYLSQNGVYLPLCLSLTKELETISFDCVMNSVTAEVEECGMPDTPHSNLSNSTKSVISIVPNSSSAPIER